jgi:hypothetical protein
MHKHANDRHWRPAPIRRVENELDAAEREQAYLIQQASAAFEDLQPLKELLVFLGGPQQLTKTQAQLELTSKSSICCAQDTIAGTRKVVVVISRKNRLNP